MVRFYRDRGPPGKRHTLNYVWIERTLGEIFDAPDLLCLSFEHVDEQFAYNLALGLGILDSIERRKKSLRCVYVHEWDDIALAEHCYDFLRLTEAHQPMIHQHARELIAYRLVDQDCSDC